MKRAARATHSYVNLWMKVVCLKCDGEVFTPLSPRDVEVQAWGEPVPKYRCAGCGWHLRQPSAPLKQLARVRFYEVWAEQVDSVCYQPSEEVEMQRRSILEKLRRWLGGGL